MLLDCTGLSCVILAVSKLQHRSIKRLHRSTLEHARIFYVLSANKLICIFCLQLGLQWQVQLRPGHAICNATSRQLHLCYVGPLLAPLDAAGSLMEASSADAAASAGFLRSEIMLELAPGQVLPGTEIC